MIGITRAWLPAQVFEPAFPSVTDAPFVERWVTAGGWAGAAVLAGLGVVAYLALARGPRRRLAVPAAAILWALAAAVVGVDQWVVTPRERLRAAAVRLVDAAVAADRDALASLLEPDARVRTRFASAKGRDRVLALTDRVPPIPSHRVRRVETDLRGPRVARTHLRLSVESDLLPRSSIWTIEWRRSDAEAWRATLIEPYWIQGFTDPAGP